MKFIGWLGKMIFSSILISVISVMTTWFTIHFIVDDWLTSMNVPASSKSLNFSKFLGNLSNRIDELTPDQKTTAEVEKPNDESASSSSEQGVHSKPPEDAVEVWAASAEKHNVIISTEDFQKKKEQLTNEDKMKIFSILVSRLPQEDMQKITGFVEDGITNDELQEVEQIVGKHLNAEEYSQLKQIINKY